MAKKSVKRSEALKLEVWRAGMNEEQLAAILHGEGPARMLAPAGSGKTRVVTHRIARLVESGIAPARILALTFSKKAADEMSERIVKLDVDGVRASTWHAFCLHVLKTDKVDGYDWEIKDSTKIELKDVVGYKGMDWKGADVNKLASFIARCKANLFEPSSDEAAVLAESLFLQDSGRATRAFHLYNERLTDKEILTFDDFLVFAAKHLEIEENRATWAAKYDYGMQDEAQDENGAQRRLAKLVFGGHGNYMKIGDCDQSIYGFRGSSPASLADMEEEWPGTKTYWLPKNYRSGANIISAANGVVEKAAPMRGLERKPMIAVREESGTVRAIASETFDDEGRRFVDWVQRGVKGGDASYSDYTALFRTNAQSRALEEALLGSRIPYVVVGGTSFYERKEVRDLLAYLRLGAGVGEAEDVRRCINAPFRFLGARFVEKVMAAYQENGESIGVPYDPRAKSRGDNSQALTWSSLVLEVADGERIQARQKESAREWAGLIAEIGKRITEGKKHKHMQLDPNDGLPVDGDPKRESKPEVILDDIVRRTRYIEWITKEEGEESIETSGAANVREMIRVAARFPTVEELLEYVDETIRASRRQRNDKQAGGERVLLMSVHRSKGLEWPHVWVAGMNENILPHPKGDPEEERRLAYVAMTRARDSLVLSYVRTLATKSGIRDSQMSRFVSDAGVRVDGPRDLSEDESDGLDEAFQVAIASSNADAEAEALDGEERMS